MNNSMLRKALEFASSSHFAQYDEYGEPYIYHPLVVALRCITDEQRIVAIMHDSFDGLEELDFDYLYEIGFDSNIVDAIDAITMRGDEEYKDYIERVKKNDIARFVKINELEDEMDSSRGELDTDVLKIYKQAYDYLIDFKC